MTAAALLVTRDRLLVEDLTTLHPAIHAVTRLPHDLDCPLPDRDGLLYLLDQEPAGAVRCIYLTVDLDDATIWARAVSARADYVAVLPDAAPWLTATLARHLDTPEQARTTGPDDPDR